MPSFQHSLLRISVENMRRSVNMDVSQIPTVRRMLDISASALYLPLGVQSKRVNIPGMHAEWLTPKQSARDKILLFLHGGGYAVGSLTTHRALAGRLATMIKTQGLIIDYRLAPENPFPAALEDATRAYLWLLHQGFQGQDIVLAGDSAGGGLCLALQLCLKDLGQPLPAGSVLFSPWVDLTFSGEEAEAHQVYDPIVNMAQVQGWASSYAKDMPLRHPMISPLYGDLQGLSPVFIQASDREVLTDDAIRLSHALGDAHVESHLQIWPDMLHVWQLFWRFVPEAQDALTHASDFLTKQLHAAATQADSDSDALMMKAAS